MIPNRVEILQTYSRLINEQILFFDFCLILFIKLSFWAHNTLYSFRCKLKFKAIGKARHFPSHLLQNTILKHVYYSISSSISSLNIYMHGWFTNMKRNRCKASRIYHFSMVKCLTLASFFFLLLLGLLAFFSIFFSLFLLLISCLSLSFFRFSYLLLGSNASTSQ